MKIKIGYMCIENPKDRYPWSGTFYKMYEHLKSEDTDIEWIQVHLNKTGLLISILFKLLCKAFNKRSLPIFLKSVSSHYYFTPNDLNKYDIIYAPCCGPYLYKLETKVPIIYMSDASPEALFNYYTFNYLPFNRNQGNYMEKIALDKSIKIIYASDWAKNIGRDFYHQNSSKIEVLELGANMDETDIKEIIQIKSSIQKDKRIHILFLGVDWIRKGGCIALDCCRLLNERGIKSIIHIVGPKKIPEEYIKEKYVNFVGFLNKNNRDQYTRLMENIAISDILLLPTMAECAGVVFNECAACGIPSFTHLTGGTGNYVIDGINGYKLPVGSSASDFADIIEHVVKSGELDNLKESSLTFYEKRNNWALWGIKIKNIINEILIGVNNR